MKFNIKKYDLVIASILFLGIWLYIFLSTGLLTSGLNYLVNDHAIYEDHVTKFDFISIAKQSLINNYFSDSPVQRFRPFYDFLQRLSPYIFEYNPFPYYFSSFFIALSTSIGLYIFAKRIKFSPVVSFLFSSLVVIGPQTSTYSYAFPIPAEASASLFIVISLILCTLLNNIQKKKNLFFEITISILVILAALTKESYILIIPAIIFFTLDYFSQKYSISYIESFKKNKIVSLTLALVFLVLIVYLKVKVTGQGYAGIDRSTFSSVNITNLIKYFYKDSILGITILIYLIFIVYNLIKKSFNFSNSYIRFCIFTFLIVAPQFILYVKSGIEGNTHYLFPLIIGLALFTVKPLEDIKYKNSYLHYALIILIFLNLNRQLHKVETYFNIKAHYLGDLHSMVHDLSGCIKNKNAKLIVYGNPYWQLEPLPAFRDLILVRLLGIKPNNIYLATVGSIDSDYFSNSFYDYEHYMYNTLGTQDKHMKQEYEFHDLKNLSIKDRQDNAAVVILNYPKYKNDFIKENADWFDSQNYALKQYPYTDHGFYCNLK